MKYFVYIVFGGLFAISAGLAIAYGGAVGWNFVEPRLSALRTQSLAVAQSVIPKTLNSDTISEIVRAIRYTALEEEDIIDAAVLALPHSADGKVTASAYIVKNLTRSDIPIEHNSEKLLPIASLTKLVTAVVARRMIEPDERIAVTKQIMSTYGNTAQFKVGETFKAEDLIYPLLMVSSNDSAEALARDYGRVRFIQAMNDFAQSIGAYRTYFADPSGLSAKNISTAGDMTIILDWIRQNDPKIFEITSLKAKTIRGHTWINPTHFLSWSQYQGGKNGYTPEANRTASSLFTIGKNKNIYAVVVLGSKERDADVARLLAKIKE